MVFTICCATAILIPNSTSLSVEKKLSSFIVIVHVAYADGGGGGETAGGGGGGTIANNDASSCTLPAKSQAAIPCFHTWTVLVSCPFRTISCNCAQLNGPAVCPFTEILYRSEENT